MDIDPYFNNGEMNTNNRETFFESAKTNEQTNANYG